MYKERLENLNNQAVILGIDLNYQPAIAVENIEDLTHQEWLNSRKKGIGGSDAGAIFGVSRYSTATEIALDKLDLSPQKEISAEQQYTLDFGHALEPVALKLYAAKTGFKVWTDRAQYKHPLYPFMLGDCDGYAETTEGERIGLEVKTYNYQMRNEWAEGVYGINGKIKNPEYAFQVAHYMAVLNLTRFDLIAVCSNNPSEMIVVTFYRDLSMEKNLIEVEKEFWVNVSKGIIPPATQLNDISFDRIVEHIVNDEVEDEITLNSSLFDTLNELDEISKKKVQLKDSLKKLEERENALKLPVIEGMDSHENAKLVVGNDEFTISFKSSARNGIDQDKLKIAYPDVYADCVKQTVTKPTFRLKRRLIK